MSLLQETLDAHGGWARWKKFEKVSARLDQGGALWALKGQAGVLDRTGVTVDLRAQWASHAPFGQEGRHSLFAPRLVTLASPAGIVEDRLEEPRESFAGHRLETPWSQTQLAYFAGCAMWTYLNMPFLLAWEGVQSQELAPWEEQGQVWRRLRATFPGSIATHSTVQTLYIGDDGLLRRHDYDVDIAGGTPGAHYIDRYVEVEGIMFPTHRRIYPRAPDGRSLAEPLVVSIDLSNIVLT
uniref:hypothetical protein n=1 Tax=unclassified Variovorax TaxID=663243 RepID=UPI000D390B9C